MRHLSAALFLLGFVGCAASPFVADSSRQREAERVVREVASEVEALRGLEFKTPVPVKVVDEASARDYMVERLGLFDYEETLNVAGRAYALLGFARKGENLFGDLLAMLEEQTGGFYDPPQGTYFLLDDVPHQAAELVSAHELTHALEDQHFDIDKRLREVLEDDDRVFARSAIHEGSAMLLLSAYLERATGTGRGPIVRLAQFEGLTPVLRRQLLGPYLVGACFLRAGRAGSEEGYPAGAVDRAYADPPSSSEQILHPEKYWGERDEPVDVAPVEVGPVLGKRWRRVGQGVLGELTLGLMVGAPTASGGEECGPGWTNAAAAGWDGDRWELWESGARTAVTLLTVWDGPEDANEFAAALATGRGLTWKVDGARVAIVGGDLRDKTRRLLDRMLE